MKKNKIDLDIIVSGGREHILHIEDYLNFERLLAKYIDVANCRIINIGAPGVETAINDFVKRNNIAPIKIMKPESPAYKWVELAQRTTVEMASLAIFFSGGEGTAKYKEMATLYDLHVYDLSRPI